MKRIRIVATGVVLMLGLAGAWVKLPGADSAPSGAEAPTIRPAAVAGFFYPGEPGTLSNTVARLLAEAPSASRGKPRALVCPHAGYTYSGPIAAHAYRRIAGADYDTVILLAASHTADFRGASVPAGEAYMTPLGAVPVSEKARALGRQSPFVVEPRGGVQRPPWAAAGGRSGPATAADTPETWEHSVEVQLPFLQLSLRNFKILPVIFGRVDPETVARGLEPILDDRTLVIVSSDLSHYHPYEEARSLDQRAVKWIGDLDVQALSAPAAEEAACGRVPLLTLLHLAKRKGWEAELLDYRNSGDTSGDRSRVVGYAAVAFYGAKSSERGAPAAPGPGGSSSLGEPDRRFLLDLARRTLRSVTAGGDLPAVDAAAVPAACRSAKGCFVTLKREGELRGCIGNILPAGPLYTAVMQNARSAALQDPRFPPVSSGEADRLHLEISVLSVPEPLTFATPEELLSRLEPERDGVVLRIGDRGATFLPQVWKELPGKEDFLNHLAQKAGCAPSAWRGGGVAVSRYRVDAFAEGR